MTVLLCFCVRYAAEFILWIVDCVVVAAAGAIDLLSLGEKGERVSK
jgi:hypothetical protein